MGKLLKENNLEYWKTISYDNKLYPIFLSNGNGSYTIMKMIYIGNIKSDKNIIISRSLLGKPKINTVIYHEIGHNLLINKGVAGYKAEIFKRNILKETYCDYIAYINTGMLPEGKMPEMIQRKRLLLLLLKRGFDFDKLIPYIKIESRKIIDDAIRKSIRSEKIKTLTNGKYKNLTYIKIKRIDIQEAIKKENKHNE